MGAETGKRQRYVGILRRHWRVVAMLALVAATAAAVRSFQRTPVYEATASVLVQPIAVTPIETGVRPGQLLDMASEQRIMRSEVVAVRAATAMRATATPRELVRHVSTDVPASSQIVRVHFRDVVPTTAERGANAFAEAFLSFRKENVHRQLANLRSGLQRQITALATKKARQDAISSPDSPATPQERRNALQLSDRYVDKMAELQRELAPLKELDPSPGSVIEPAQLPTSATGPGRLLSIGIGLVAGLFAGTVVAFVRAGTDPRLRGREDLAERLGRPVLGQIPKLGRRKRRAGERGRSSRSRTSPVVLDEPDSSAAEAYRALRTRLTRLAAQLDVTSIMVVSPGPGEGKTTTAANLAVALAESGRDVLLVSADLRRPRIHEFFGLPNRSGLSDLLADDPAAATGGSRQAASELWSVAPHLWLLPSGPSPPQPSALLDSDAMRQFLKEQRHLFDYVLLDCPPALVTDSLALASLVDAVLVVADAKETERSAIERLRDELDQPGAKLLGSVLNRASRSGEAASYYAG